MIRRVIPSRDDVWSICITIILMNMATLFGVLDVRLLRDAISKAVAGIIFGL